MATLKQKTKLLKVLKGLNKDDFLEAEIINDIIAELEALKASIPDEETLSPYFEGVKVLEKEYSNISTSVKGLSQSLTNADREFKLFGKLTDERIITLSKETSKVIKDLKDELEKIQVRVLELTGRGGGSKPLQIQNNGTVANIRYADINLIPSTGITITTANDDVKKITKLTLTASGGGGSSFLTATGTVNGVNTIFTFSSAPSAICVDQGRFMQKVSSDTTVNWTGTTTVTLSVAPNSDIFGLG